MTKRDEDSSLMQLKEEFRTYEALRREHDSQIVQIAMEGGLRIAPDQWSSLLYGDQSHKSHMQSIIDKVGGAMGAPFLPRVFLTTKQVLQKKNANYSRSLFLTEPRCHELHTLLTEGNEADRSHEGRRQLFVLSRFSDSFV